MATQFVCAVFDVAAGCYGRPFFVSAKGLAIRGFIDEVRKGGSESPIASHPSDFTLFHIADFDDNTGVFSAHISPDKLITGLAASQVE